MASVNFVLQLHHFTQKSFGMKDLREFSNTDWVKFSRKHKH